jgi:hypothetical protein
MPSLDKRRRTAANPYLTHILLAALSMLCLQPALSAPKTDIVIFKNGDKLTGEIKSLERGRLNLSTDAIGTIAIEWDKVHGVVSNQTIQVETGSGVRYFGVLTFSEETPGLIVSTASGSEKLEMDRVIVMAPIEGTGIDALDIDLSFGYNFAKAGQTSTGTFGIDMHYRSLKRIESLSASTNVTDSDTQDSSKRANLLLQHTRLWKDRWYNGGNVALERNDELGLDQRTSIGANGGRYLIQSNSMLLAVEGGLQVARERLVDEEQDKNSVEALLTVKWDWFLFQNPELDWSTTMQIIPSLTESGRWRGEFDTALKWEIVNDLKWNISIYSSFDNKPTDAAASTSDYGVNTGLTYEF